jgi:hypothetical protein
MNKIQKIKEFKKENNNLISKKVESQLDLILEGQEINQNELRRGFIGLATQNQKLFNLNQELNQQLETVVEELNQTKRERQEKAARKEARANRKRLPKRDPMTPQIYKELIKEAEGPTYLNVRLRLALCLLVIDSFILFSAPF